MGKRVKGGPKENLLRRGEKKKSAQKEKGAIGSTECLKREKLDVVATSTVRYTKSPKERNLGKKKQEKKGLVPH